MSAKSTLRLFAIKAHKHVYFHELGGGKSCARIPNLTNSTVQKSLVKKDAAGGDHDPPDGTFPPSPQKPKARIPGGGEGLSEATETFRWSGAVCKSPYRTQVGRVHVELYSGTGTGDVLLRPGPSASGEGR